LRTIPWLTLLKISHSIIPIVCDIRSKESLAAAAAEVVKQSPFVNTVIANSGMGGPPDAVNGGFSSAPTLTQLREHLWSTDQSEANSVSQVNTIGSYFTFLAFLELLEAGNTHHSSRGKDGYIPSQFITNSSIAGLSRANMYGYPYAASKAGLIHLTKMLSTEFASYGIRANTIAPGLYITEATDVSRISRLLNFR
jgi:NAD(P)-dependent dehydrogenase (short-subunit alcohol dehydrogenase family)